MREKMIVSLFKEVYGPRNGSEEEIKANPWKEYITGVIIPKSWEFQEDTDPDAEIIKTGEFSLNEDESGDVEIDSFIPSELDPKMRPKSFGISFIVNTEFPSFDICVTWGRYFEIGKSEDKKKKKWKRNPYHKILKPEELSFKEENYIYDEDDGGIYLKIRRTPWKNGTYHITVSLVNNLNAANGKTPPISSCIFQPSMRIILKNDTQIVDPEMYNQSKKELQFLYRKRAAMARGHMCSAIWENIDYMDNKIFKISELWPDGEFFGDECLKFIKSDIRSEFIPLYPIPTPCFDWDKINFKNKPKLYASCLSEMWGQNKINEYLNPLVEGYRLWIQSNKEVNDEETAKNKDIIKDIITKQTIAADRIQKGIEILKTDENANLAFCFANKTIQLQHEWKNLGKKQTNKEKLNEKAKEEVKFEWRPFQLAFFLMNIESIYNENSPDREILDLLWIPTGGGKTEAYMGLMAFTMALRRIKALKGDSSNKTGAGTSIISRYTLRILTIQQFRRTLKMVTAAEYLRVTKTDNGIGWRPDSSIEGDWIYGSSRFSAGMWVGGAVSPNHLRTKNERIGAIDNLRGLGGEGEPAQVVTCPVCDNFLSIPDIGLPKGFNSIYVVVKSNLTPNDSIETPIKQIIENTDYLENIEIIHDGHLEGYMTVNLQLNAEKYLELHDIETIWDNIKKELDFKVVSLSLGRPGYFGSLEGNGRKYNLYNDFEIWCTDPTCPLNKEISWSEGIPKSESSNIFPDNLFEKEFKGPFSPNSRIPIPAYTVDEQIYSKCPTVIISTADKIARLAAEPRASAIFGNVDTYNSCYGYRRDDLFPKGPTSIPTEKCKKTDINIEPFSSPDLIIQDELHLIDGPLGSMFGLYEAIVEGIIRKSNGRPKYIASTATIKNAESQVKLLFAKELFQFPPYGLNIEDSFFVKEIEYNQGWTKTQEGRIYMGIYSPGLGPFTPLIRLWSTLLKIPYDYMDAYKNELKYFWTLVGYFNAIRELGGGRALYREDIQERLNDICDDPDNKRELDQERIIELSSRESSTKVPVLLSELERDGNMSSSKIHPDYDAIFTTSMFGTGVDISHLSAMVVNGQPKTTGSYIQATGRIGRSYGGLVITFLRAGRPRDLSHYEMFTSYHHRIQMEVEPVSVSPFSRGALWRGLGPSTVAFLRNICNPSVKWHGDEADIINQVSAQIDIKYLITHLENRFKKIYGKKYDFKPIIDDLECEIDLWKDSAKKSDNLIFIEYPWKLPKEDVVLGDPAHKYYDKRVVYENAPQSLREIEETTAFTVGMKKRWKK